MTAAMDVVRIVHHLHTIYIYIYHYLEFSLDEVGSDMENATDLLTATQVCDNRMECHVSAEACGICGIL